MTCSVDVTMTKVKPKKPSFLFGWLIRRVTAWLRGLLDEQFSRTRHLVNTNLQEIRTEYAALSRKLDVSVKLPCFVLLHGKCDKNAWQTFLGDKKSDELVDIDLASGIHFMSKGECHTFDIRTYVSGDVQDIVASVSEPFVITDARIGNLSFTTSESNEGVSVYKEIRLGKAFPGNKIRIDVLYPEEGTS